MEPTFSVVIPTFNRAQLLARTVQAFLVQEEVSFELIVVDDGSSDSTPEVLAGFRDPRLRVLRQPNAGLAAARNAGLAQAQGRYVLFNDDDVVPEAGFLRAHLGLHQRYKGAAGVSRTYVPEALGHEPFTRFWRARAEAGVRGKADSAPLGWGGFWFASLSLPLKQAEAFAPFRGYGWEEHELGWRLWRKGVRPRLVAGARAAHEDRCRFGHHARQSTQHGAGGLAVLPPSSQCAGGFLDRGAPPFAGLQALGLPLGQGRAAPKAARLGARSRGFWHLSVFARGRLYPGTVGGPGWLNRWSISWCSTTGPGAIRCYA